MTYTTVTNPLEFGSGRIQRRNSGREEQNIQSSSGQSEFQVRSFMPTPSLQPVFIRVHSWTQPDSHQQTANTGPLDRQLDSQHWSHDSATLTDCPARLLSDSTQSVPSRIAHSLCLAPLIPDNYLSRSIFVQFYLFIKLALLFS